MLLPSIGSILRFRFVFGCDRFVLFVAVAVAVGVAVNWWIVSWDSRNRNCRAVFRSRLQPVSPRRAPLLEGGVQKKRRE